MDYCSLGFMLIYYFFMYQKLVARFLLNRILTTYSCVKINKDTINKVNSTNHFV